jgi:hypothetical protein
MITPEVTALVPPPTIRTCEANELINSINGSAPPLYTSAMGNATTLTVQAYPVEEILTCAEDTELPVIFNLSNFKIYKRIQFFA